MEENYGRCGGRPGNSDTPGVSSRHTSCTATSCREFAAGVPYKVEKSYGRNSIDHLLSRRDECSPTSTRQSKAEVASLVGRAAATSRHLHVSTPILVHGTPSFQEMNLDGNDISDVKTAKHLPSTDPDTVPAVSKSCERNSSGLLIEDADCLSRRPSSCELLIDQTGHLIAESETDQRLMRRSSREFLMDEPDRLSRRPSADFLAESPEDSVLVFDQEGTCTSVSTGGEHIELVKHGMMSSTVTQREASNPIGCFASAVLSLLGCWKPSLPY